MNMSKSFFNIMEINCILEEGRLRDYRHTMVRTYKVRTLRMYFVCTCWAARLISDTAAHPACCRRWCRRRGSTQWCEQRRL